MKKTILTLAMALGLLFSVSAATNVEIMTTAKDAGNAPVVAKLKELGASVKNFKLISVSRTMVNSLIGADGAMIVDAEVLWSVVYEGEAATGNAAAKPAAAPAKK